MDRGTSAASVCDLDCRPELMDRGTSAASVCDLDCRPELMDRGTMTNWAPDAEQLMIKPSFVTALQTELADQKRMCLLLEERLETSILSAQLPMECSDETGMFSEGIEESEVASGRAGAQICDHEPPRGEDASTQSNYIVVHNGTQCSAPVPASAVLAMPKSERCGATVGTQTAHQETNLKREPQPHKSSSSQTPAPSACWDKGVQTGDAEIKRLEAAQVTIEGLKESLTRLQQEKNELEGQIQDAVDLHSAGEQVSFLKKQLQLTRVHARGHHEEVADLRRQLSGRQAQAEELADRVAYLQREAGEMRLELQEKDRVLESALVQVRAAAESAVESARLAEACKKKPERAPDAGYGVPDELCRTSLAPGGTPAGRRTTRSGSSRRPWKGRPKKSTTRRLRRTQRRLPSRRSESSGGSSAQAWRGPRLS